MTVLLLCVLGFVGLVAGVVCLTTALWQFLAQGVRAVCGGLGPWHEGSKDIRVPAAGPDEPAELAYWWRQMWVDAATAGDYGVRVVWLRFTDRWMRHTTANLFRGVRSTGLVERNSFVRMVMWLVAPGTFVGALVGAVLATLVLALTLAVFALLLGLVWLGAAATVLVLRGVDRGWVTLRRIRVKCPYPGCYRPVPLAVHRCPGCREPHARLRPGRYGALRHMCSCGQRLGATRLARRSRLTALCPHCDQVLPNAVGTTRVVHAPLVGGTSSGKTMLMAAMVEGLHAWSRRSDLRVEYASTDDRQTANSLNQELTQGTWAHATTGGQPRAFMLTVTLGRRRRLLYLYDPMGESLEDAERVRAQHYLAHTDGVVLVADVLAEPAVRRKLSGADAERATAARPSPQGPWETYQRLAGELSALTGRRGKLSVATVVTKRDVLDQLGSLPVAGPRIDSWLTDIGLGGLVRALGHDFRSDRYWAVSAHAATGAGSLDSEQRRAAEPVLWLLAASGLRTGALVGPDPAGKKSGGSRTGAAAGTVTTDDTVVTDGTVTTEDTVTADSTVAADTADTADSSGEKRFDSA
ncbi:TRAFAC clade GTPase domain-containing protein [Streptomyces sp. CWNU-52B]|uniref:TRAFAC clade GTPase domain-containing protein n=1 Tax=unclassified Streptomyces TaxID=2593676 RepID=UPI0039BF84D4